VKKFISNPVHNHVGNLHVMINSALHSVVGPAVTFRVLPNSQNLTANEVSEKAGE